MVTVGTTDWSAADLTRALQLYDSVFLRTVNVDSTLTFEPQGHLVFADNIGVESVYTLSKLMLYGLLSLPEHGEFHHIRNFEHADGRNVMHNTIQDAQVWFKSLPENADEQRFTRSTALDLEAEKSLEDSLLPLYHLICL